MPIRLLVLFAVPLGYFLLRIRQYGLSIDTDEWGILNASRSILRGNLTSSPAIRTRRWSLFSA